MSDSDRRVSVKGLAANWANIEKQQAPPLTPNTGKRNSTLSIKSNLSNTTEITDSNANSDKTNLNATTSAINMTIHSQPLSASFTASQTITIVDIPASSESDPPPPPTGEDNKT